MFFFFFLTVASVNIESLSHQKHWKGTERWKKETVKRERMVYWVTLPSAIHPWYSFSSVLLYVHFHLSLPNTTTHQMCDFPFVRVLVCICFAFFLILCVNVRNDGRSLRDGTITNVWLFSEWCNNLGGKRRHDPWRHCWVFLIEPFRNGEGWENYNKVKAEHPGVLSWGTEEGRVGVV